MDIPLPGELYEHFKGGKYLVIDIIKNPDEIGKKLVICKQIYRGKKFPEGTEWRRTLEEFCGYKIFKKNMTYGDRKYKKGNKIKRYIRLGMLE